MRPIVGFLLAVLAISFARPAYADAELVLKDGRTLSGVEVRLEAGYYLLETEDGEVIAIPALLVREVHLLDDRLTEEGVTIGEPRDLTGTPSELDALPRLGEKRPGWRQGRPQDLAGGPWNNPDAQRQTAVLGKPARFRESPIPFRYKPVHAWDRERNVLAGSRSSWQRGAFDAVWRPKSGLDHSTDVLAASRSTWSTASRAAKWNPSNSFSRLRADLWWGKDPIPDSLPTEFRRDDECGWCDDVANRPKRFTVPRKEPIEAGHCARKLFARVADLKTLEWAELEAEVWDDLPPGLHRAWTADGPRALYSIAGDECRVIAGDLDELLGIDLTEKDALAYAVSEWNRRPAELSVPLPGTPTSQIDLAFLLASLFETATSGKARARMELLANADAVERWAGNTAECSRSASLRRAQRANVDRNFARPDVDLRDDALQVSFLAWIGLGGEVHAYALTFKDDGRLALTRETVAGHLGEHEDRP